MAEAPKTWILTGSPENVEATRGRGFTEDREEVWPGKPGKADPHPWRFDAGVLLERLRAAAGVPA